MSYLSMRMREIREEDERRKNPFAALLEQADWEFRNWASWRHSVLLDFRQPQPDPLDYVSYMGRGA